MSSYPTSSSILEYIFYNFEILSYLINARLIHVAFAWTIISTKERIGPI